MSRIMVLVLTLALAAALIGCGKPKSIAGSTPRATAEAFVAAIQAGNYDVVAAGYDYETYARTENPDWDTFGESQRKLIVGKLQEQQAEKLGALAGMLAGEVTVGEAQAEGERATVDLTTGSTTLKMSLIKVDGLWKVLGVEE